MKRSWLVYGIIVAILLLGVAVNWSQARQEEIYKTTESPPPPPPSTFTWTGNSSTNWHNYDNWTRQGGATGNCPDANDIVNIPAGRPRYPMTYNGNPVCKYLRIYSGASMTLSGGYDLTVLYDITISGSLSVTNPGSYISCGRKWTNYHVFNHGQSRVYFNGSSHSRIEGNAVTHFYNLYLAKNYATVNLYPLTNFHVVNNLTITKGRLNLSYSSATDPTINITGDLIL